MVLQWFVGGLVAVGAFRGWVVSRLHSLSVSTPARPLHATNPETLANKPAAPAPEATGTVAPQQTSLG
jgi:hypothetical protein